MPYLASIGTDLGCWGTRQHWVAGDDEDTSTLAGEAGAPHRPLTSTSLKLTVPSRELTKSARKVLASPSGSGAKSLTRLRVTSVGGALPVKPSGGVKAKGQPPGATGIAQCAELFAHLRGEAVNQVDGARVALARDIGGPTAVSAVLEGPANGAG
jgi:hypothetical protein